MRYWLITLCILGGAQFSYAHSDAITKCDRNLPVKSVKKIGESVLPNGLLSEGYDRNGDGKTDIQVLSHITGYKKRGDVTIIEHRKNPIFWIVDVNFDESPDLVFIDKKGKGRCEDIVLYRDLLTQWSGDAQQEPFELKGDL